MKEYLMLFKNDKSENAEPPSPEQMHASMMQWQAWIQGIAEQGKYCGTNRLLPEGKTIKAGNIITDGPYAEAKEMIGGYLLVKADSLDEAVELAKGCPGLLNGYKVEVRTVLPMDGDVGSSSFLGPKNS